MQAFLDGRIPFGAIAQTIVAVLERHDAQPAKDLAAVLDADAWARREAEARCC